MANGKIKADTLEHSTAGSLDTQYVVNGSNKVWINFTGVTTTTIRDSFNISSITDVSTGITHPVALTSAMANDDYAGSYYQMGAAGTGRTDFNNDYVGLFQEYDQSDKIPDNFCAFTSSFLADENY